MPPKGTRKKKAGRAGAKAGRRGKSGKAAAGRSPGRGSPGIDDVYVLTDLEQVKTLADPLRVRILECLCEERTTKQVADAIGERPTKLYHHVEALEKAGLIRLTRTRQNRGTLEKYFQAVAKAFRTDPRVFSASPEGKDEIQVMQKLIDTVMERTTVDLRNLLTSESGTERLEEEGLLSYLEIHAPDRKVRSLQRKLRGLLEEIAAESEHGGAKPKKELRRYRLTLVYFPLDKPGG